MLKKLKLGFFGKLFSSTDRSEPYQERIEFVTKWRYLGFHILSGREFSFSAENDLRSFHKASNTILNVLNKPSEVVQLQLLYSNCIPILSYGCCIKEFSNKEMTQCNTAINNCIRKIFTFKRYESIRDLRVMFSYPSIYAIFKKAKNRFHRHLSTTDNSVLRFLYQLQS